jgi:hypothetical protein
VFKDDKAYVMIRVEKKVEDMKKSGKIYSSNRLFGTGLPDSIRAKQSFKI